VQVRKIDHKNHYDFTQRHRHSYFEIILFIKGGGNQLIDFNEYEVKSNTCYLVCPQQIHLLNRAPGSYGFVLQFKEEAVFSVKLQKLLQERAWSGAEAILFEQDEELMNKVTLYINMLQVEKDAKFNLDIQRYILQALLFELVSVVEKNTPTETIDPHFYEFKRLLDMNFKEHQTVSYYLNRLDVGEKKLAALSKKYQGITPLQIIHNRILLDAKRCLVFEDKAHKEIAYDLGFDSPASFSAFIKKKTGFTATELAQNLQK